jgi:hypothetical protein
MPDSIRVYVNGKGCSVPSGALVRDALAAAVPELLPACDAGEAVITDGRGLPVALDAPVAGGTVLRALRPSRRGAADSDD